MRIGRPFRIKDIENAGDTFVPLYTKCKTCGKGFKIIAIEIFATDALYGSRTLDCMSCADYWTDTMETLIHGGEAHAPILRVQLQALELAA